MSVWVYTFGSVLIVSLISLIGVFTLSLKEEVLKKILIYMVSFAVGGLFGDALIHILPEAFEQIDNRLLTSFLVLAGIMLFFILEKFLLWQHCHIPTSKNHIHPVGKMNLIGGALHNLIDGVIIGASYSVSIPIGITTTLAVIFHEIPQEMGHFGILVHSGLSAKKALFYNLLSALTSCVGALLALLIGPKIANFPMYVLPITAGGFLYIAGSDLIPELHDHHRHDVKPTAAIGQFFCILLGVGVMALLIVLE